MFVPYKSRLRQWWEAHFPAGTQVSVAESPCWTRQQRLFAWAVLVITSAAVLLPNLSYPLIEPDETRYAQIAMEMNESRDWITPTLDGQAYLDKPPLMYWLTAMSFKTFGNHETAARLPSMLSAFATILLTFSWGSRIVGRRAAWLAAMSLAMCGGFVLAGRFLILDSLLALFTTLCMLSGYIAVRENRHRWAWWMVSGIACALGVLTKGPIALVLCAPPLVISGWLRADHSRTRLIHWVAFIVPMIVVCVPWYLAVAKFNSQFVNYFFFEHNFRRFTQGSNHKQPFWFYLPIVFAAMFPASLLLPSVGVFLASGARLKRSQRSKDLGFLFCGSVWILVFFSAASCKLPTYILPAIPLMCLLTGVMLNQTVFRRGASGRIANHLRRFPQRAALILIVSCVVVAFVDIGIAGELSAYTALAMTACVGIAFATVKNWNRDVAFSRPAWGVTATVATCVLMFAGSVLVPTISSKRSVYLETQRLAKAQPDAWIVFYGENSHGASFQLPPARTTFFSREREDDFKNFVAHQSHVIVVTGDERIHETQQILALTHELTVSPNHEHVYTARRVANSVIKVAGTSQVSR